jgi:tetratricopeptide (TPR) repeat protein
MKVALAKTKLRRSSRTALFRLAALLLGLAPFVLVEMALRAYGVGQPDLHVDPYVGFSATRPLFALNESGDRFEIAPSRRVHFFPDSLSVAKAPNEFRIFCIGDSTVQGNPWETETSFTTWLELSLTAADATRKWNVINCGGISYASYRMVPIVDEVLGYEPDLVIVHCSHNEFLEDRTYETLKRVPRPLRAIHDQVAQLRVFGLMKTGSSLLRESMRPVVVAGLPTVPPARAVVAGLPTVPLAPAVVAGLPTVPPARLQVSQNLPVEVQALLDYRNGSEFYHHDDAWHRGVIEHYEFNLRRMALLAQRANVPLVLMNPACQLRDSPPFKAEHRSGLSQADEAKWDALWLQARSYYASNPPKSVELLREALAIDDQHAGLHYDLAKCFDVLRQFDEARYEYVQAKELDVCPLRILDSMNDIVLAVAHETKTPVVDVRALFDRLSRNGIPGSDWFADHVHPTIAGYQRIGDELANEIVRLGFVRPSAAWLERKEERYQSHLDSLPPIYFVRAQQRLKALMLWANGRVTKERPEKLTANER